MLKLSTTIEEFKNLYPTDDACLAAIFKHQKKKVCVKCKKVFKYHKLKERKCYSCQFCGYQIAPLAGTMFHKSRTPLTKWFYALYLFATSRNGISAVELSHTLGVTEKCAWRIGHACRKLCKAANPLLSGTVEVDEAYMGGVWKNYAGQKPRMKVPVVGMVERSGRVRAFVTKDTTRHTLHQLIRRNVKPGTRIITDDYTAYKKIERYGYRHKSVNHSKRVYVSGKLHTNTIENFWSQLKRYVRGTHVSVSPQHLQAYVQEFAFRYNQRISSASAFSVLLQRAKVNHRS